MLVLDLLQERLYHLHLGVSDTQMFVFSEKVSSKISK